MKYKTEAAHYPAVQENLVSVLEEHLSQEGEWTAEMKINWEAAMEAISNIMIEAANAPERYEAELKAAEYLADGFKATSSKPWELATTF